MENCCRSEIAAPPTTEHAGASAVLRNVAAALGLILLIAAAQLLLTFVVPTAWGANPVAGGLSPLAVVVAAGAVVFAGRNLDRRRQAQEALRQRDEGYQLLFEHAHDAILLADTAGRCVEANAQAEALTGYRRDELLRLRLTDLMPPADAERGRRLYRDVVAHGRRTDEFDLVRKDGAARRVEVAASRAGGDRYQTVLRDVTERKRAEEALRRSHGELELQVQEGAEALEAEAAARRAADEARRAADEARRAVFQAAPLAFVILDPQGRVQMWNPAAERLFGWPAADVVGRPYPLTPPGQEAEYRVHLDRVLAGEAVVGVETRRRHRDGSLVDVSLAAAPLRGPDGTVIGVLIVLADLRDRKNLEQQVRQAQKMEVVGQLAGGIAHDFNNLLTVINGYSELLLTRLGPDDAARGVLEEICKAGERAAGLTKQLLAFSRKQAIQARVLDLNAVVADVETLLRRLIGEDVSLAAVLKADLGWVKGDAGQFQQVLMNLAVNARDAMPQGGTLTIETRNVDLDESYAEAHYQVAAGRYVLLAVTDTGCGMPPDVLARVFEPFFTTKAIGKGTGLGLATVYGIVKQYGGHVEVYSEPGVGTTFKVYLPRVDEAGHTLAWRPARPAANRGTETVLLVEDEAGVRALARTILQGHGYTVLEAGDGEEALRVGAGDAGVIHLLVTDVVMPGMSGRVLAQRLRALRPELKVLYLSGYTDTAMLRHGVLEAEVEFLLKPFSPTQLAQTVREVLDRPEAVLS